MAATEREISRFVSSFVKEIEEDNGSVFVGAGLSVGAGFVDWRSLLKPIADDLDIEISRETDLVALAQFHVNEEQNRAKINQILIDEFARQAKLTENHQLLARLPMSVYWTTNYDKLIERALEEAGRTPDIKYSKDQLSTTRRGRDAVVYKMHGDIDHPANAVLIKDDYEKYSDQRRPFLTALAGDLVSKTFLFLGFSFSDPNLDYVLSRIRVSLDNCVRQHYAILREVQKDDAKDDAEFEYMLRRQQLFINDLKRFGIKALLIECHDQITGILKRIYDTYRRKSVLVSGAAHEYGNRTPEQAEALVRKISSSLIGAEYRVVSGFGLGIGSAVISGGLERVFNEASLSVSDHMVLRPFPQIEPEGMTRPELYKKYREDLVSHAGVAIFIFGNKIDERGNLVEAKGMDEEFEIAKSQGLALIPIGATGYVAERLWRTVNSSFDEYFPKQANLREPFDALGDPSVNDEALIAALMRMVRVLSART